MDIEKDVKFLTNNGINSICLVKKMVDNALKVVSFQFDYWVKDEIEQFHAYPSTDGYDIYRYKIKDTVKKNVKPEDFTKVLSKLKRVQINGKTGELKFF